MQAANPTAEGRSDERRVRAAVVIAGLDPMDGGPAYSVPRLCAALAAAGVEPTLLSVSTAPTDRFEDGYRDRRFLQTHTRIPVLRNLRCSPGLSRALPAIAAQANVVHGHGLWLLPNLATARAATGAGKPLVVSPRGMLSPAALSFSPLRKQAVWTLWQHRALRGAACLHATSDQEYREIRALGFVNPVAVIGNGIDLPASAEPVEPRERVVLSLGRMHPKKALDRLLQAWARIEGRHPGWRLRLAGPNEAGHARELRGLSKALRLARATIEGPLYGEAKSAAYRTASLFALPSLNENFGITVAEALAAGVPAIATRGAPWAGLEAQGCGWWIELGVEPLAAALEQAMSMPAEALQVMGQRGRAWMARAFSWEAVAGDMLAVYQWLAGGTEPPPSVRMR